MRGDWATDGQGDGDLSVEEQNKSTVTGIVHDDTLVHRG